MSKTTDFINDRIALLTKEINTLEMKRMGYLDNMNACDSEIMEKQDQIDRLNKESEKIKISDSDLESLKGKGGK